MDEGSQGIHPSEKLKKLHEELEEVQVRAYDEIKKRSLSGTKHALSPLATALQKASQQQQQIKSKEEISTPAKSQYIAKKPTYLEEHQVAGVPSPSEAGRKGILKNPPAGTGRSKMVFRLGLGLLVIALIIVGIFFLTRAMSNKSESAVTNWDECIQKESSVIQESYPRLCVTEDGNKFIEPVKTATPTLTLTPTTNFPEVSEREGEGCVIAGCNDELCVDEVEGDIASICLYQPKLKCYKTAVCEKQQDGLCSWTQTEELQACLDQY